MPAYPLPPWLNPNVALGYGDLAGSASRAALSAQVQRDKLSQDSAQFAIESQQRAQEITAANAAKQEQLNYEHQLDQQKLAVEQAYKQQQVGLQTADLDLAKKQFDLKTQDAARKFSANQSFQKAMLPKEQGGEGLTATQAALKYMAPSMTGTELGRLSAMDKPPAVLAPAQDVPGMPGYKAFDRGGGHFQLVPPPSAAVPTNAPPALPVADEDGNVIGHYAINPVTHRAELIRPPSGDAADFNKTVNERKQELGQGKKSTTVDFKTADDVRAAYRSKKLTAQEASKILKDKFGFE